MTYKHKQLSTKLVGASFLSLLPACAERSRSKPACAEPVEASKHPSVEVSLYHHVKSSNHQIIKMSPCQNVKFSNLQILK